MSRFSEHLKRLLSESGKNIYQISKNGGIDRTTIHRAITGERLPGLPFVERLCACLRVSPGEKQELLEYYTIAKIGEKNYTNRLYIKNLIEQIAQLHAAEPHGASGVLPPGMMETAAVPYQVFYGQYEVNACVKALLEREAASLSALYVSVPFEYAYFFDCLRQLYWDSNGNWDVTHIVCLAKNAKEPINLKLLMSILPLSFCVQNGYKPRYFYAGAPALQDISQPMPYYFFTREHLLTLSADFTAGILYGAPELIEVYQRHFSLCISETRPFVTNLSASLDLISTHIQALKAHGDITHVIEPQPCFANYYTHEMVELHLRRDVEARELMVGNLLEFYDQYKMAEFPLHSFFSPDGLLYFVETGILSDLPPQYAIPFSVEERELLLCAMREDILHDTRLFRALNPAKLSISPIATIQIYLGGGLMLIAANEKYISSCFLDEDSIQEAFRDFFEGLADSDLVYDKKDTLQLVDSCIRRVLEIKHTGKRRDG